MIKSIIRRGLVLLYLGAMVLSVLIAIKPGAAIFYYKKRIDNQAIKRFEGFAYSYYLKINPATFRTPGILLYEDGHLLSRSDKYIVGNNGKSTYFLNEPAQGEVDITFSSSDNSSPITNGRKYSLYIPLNFISHSNGIVYLVILAFGLAWFLWFALIISDHRKTILKSPKGILIVLDDFFDYVTQILRSDVGTVGIQLKARAEFWKQLFSITTLAAFFYVFMEWLFFVTKSSFLSYLSLPDKAEVFLLSGLALSIMTMAVLAAYIGLDFIAVVARLPGFTRHLGEFIPTVILSGLALLLIDNFTYTVFRFGISTSAGKWRAVYLLLLIFLFFYIYIQMLKYFRRKGMEFRKKKSSNRLFYLALGFLVISTGLALTRLDIGKLTASITASVSHPGARHPNIILLGSDGVSASNLSVYGYERDTTPHLQEIAQNSLVAENAFSNSGKTAGSFISILTGKLPTTTRVGLSPDILTGVNSYQHLPGILKSNGYTTFEIGVATYVDAYEFNMQNGFDMVNNRTQSSGILGSIVRNLGYGNIAYFLDSLTQRISDRILQIFYIRDMQNAYNLVNEPAYELSDSEKIHQLLNLLDQPEPLFIHVHLLGTHGNTFAPPIQVFSKGEVQNNPWMVDFYDDAILSFDNYVAQVIDQLKKNGQYENTILIIYTDHDIKRQVSDRIPLIIHFPGDSHAGRITQNVQNLDIAPTILDYLRLPVPNWMGGESLLKGNLDSHRLIFGSFTVPATRPDAVGRLLLDPELMKPPFYQFAYMNTIDCQKWYRLDLKTLTWSAGEVTGDTDPCTQQSLLSFDAIKQATINRLAQDGFDTASLH
jgi:glucan phosphoethanolaminetransferase (alkaline phosphatase superfamily)